MTNVYSKIGKFYETSLSVTGFNKALSRYIKDLSLDIKPKSQILEIGAGPNPISIPLLEKIPDAHAVITDNDQIFLEIISKKFGDLIKLGVVMVEKIDINHLEILRQCGEFDIIIAGGVLGYSVSMSQTIQNIYNLLKSSGLFINFEQNNNLLGPLCAKLYDYKLPTNQLMKDLLYQHNFKDISIRKIPIKYLPLNLTRQLIMASKT